MKNLEVGTLRQQSALKNADCRVVLIPSLELKKLLGNKKIVLTQCYPDTCDEDGRWNSTFKIEAEIVDATE
jgi:hypothetical protein